MSWPPSPSPASAPPSSPSSPALSSPDAAGSGPGAGSGPPGADVPAGCQVPHFAPVRVGAGRHQLARLVRHRRRAVAAGLAVTAAALVAVSPGRTDETRGHAAGAPDRERRAVETVAAPVRIADGATVALLSPGDRVDVIAAETSANGGHARVIARGARVAEVPAPEAAPVADSGALVVLTVPRPVAARLAGASATARLAVTLC